MKRTTLSTAILAAAFFSGSVDDLSRFAPESRGKSVCAFSTGSDGSVDLLIYGPIGDYFWGDGITAQSIVDQLATITAPTINVRINSDGGVVMEGLAIYNALKRHGATINVSIDGIAASIASLIAMAGNTVEMHANTMLMVHGPSSWVGGNASEHRRIAGVLDAWSMSMRESYVAKVGAEKATEIDALLMDGVDHYFTAAEALSFGFIDRIADSEAEEATDEKAAAAALLAYVGAISSQTVSATAALAATLRTRIQSACTPAAFSMLRMGHQRAVLAQLQESPMKQQCQLIMANAAGPAAPAAPVATPVVAAAPAAAVAGDTSAADAAINAIATRNTAISGVFAQFRDVSGIRDLEVACLSDPRITVEQAQGKLLAKLGTGAAPLADVTTARVEAGDDERDRYRVAGVSAVLARAGLLVGNEREVALRGNPLANATLLSMAEQCLMRAGISTRGMDRDTLASRVLAQQTTSDFVILLENALHKVIVGAYNAQPFTWERFCKIGTLSDYRPHGRYSLSSFSDLAAVTESGEYTNGSLGDGAKETIQGQRKGRILALTPEVLVNDDLGFLVDLAATLGRAAGRTIEKDVYALFALNSGAGPTMADGNPLFYASRASGTNIDSTSAAPTVTSMDASAQVLRTQKDIGGNDYLDLEPAIWLGPVTKAGAARTVINSEYDPDANNKLQRYNIARNIVREVVASPRLAGNRWYLFADPATAPVLEVAFLNGVREPQIAQEENFRTEGVSWRVTHKYAAGATGTIGAVTNAGA